MWSKMLLLSFNIFIPLVLVVSDEPPPLYIPIQSIQTYMIQNNFKSYSTLTPQLSSPAPLTITTTDLSKRLFFPTEKLESSPQIAAAAAAAEATTAATPSPSPPPQDNNRSKEILILGLFDAALNIDRSMHKLIAQDSKSDGNIIISPISIAAAMSLILLGAGGETKTEIGKLFGYDENTLLHTVDNNNQNYKNLGMLLNYFQYSSAETLGTRVNLAKAVFIQNGYNVLQNYKTLAKEYLNSEIITVDFNNNGQRAQQTVNKWVSLQTHGKINEIMPNIPGPETKTVITSALYFIGEWEIPFFVNYTRIKPFYCQSNVGDKNAQDLIYVPMMMGNSDILYHKNENLGFSAMGLPYKGNKFVSYFVLPDPSISLRDLVDKMTGKILQNITRNTTPIEFTYFVPKMTLKSFTNLRPVLQNLGVNKIFDISKADFSNFTTNTDSFISDILHKVEIIIDEIGTVASAATTVIISRGGQPPFNVNRPFIYFIHHVESDTIVFWSTVYKPTPHTTTPPPPNQHRHRKH